MVDRPTQCCFIALKQKKIVIGHRRNAVAAAADWPPPAPARPRPPRTVVDGGESGQTRTSGLGGRLGQPAAKAAAVAGERRGETACGLAKGR